MPERQYYSITVSYEVDWDTAELVGYKDMSRELRNAALSASERKAGYLLQKKYLATIASELQAAVAKDLVANG